MTGYSWFRRHQLMSVASLGPVAEIAIGYAAFVLLLYWSHRARHHVGVLWRWMHQMHHSPQRIEILTAFYKHPLEIVAESMLAAVLAVPFWACRRAACSSSRSSAASPDFSITGTSPRRAGSATSCSGPRATASTTRPAFTPTTTRSCRCRHAVRDLPQPRRFDGQCGFGPRGETAIGGLLLGRDVGMQSAGEPG